MTSYERARAAIDALHAADPIRSAEGKPNELDYADRMEGWVTKLAPEASPILRLAARCQHLERWSVPRGSFPEGRAGYLEWRRSLYVKQANRARGVLVECGVPEPEASEAATWIAKEGLKTNPGTQALEDAACLVFLETIISDFAAAHPDYTETKFIEIIRKTWKKMSPAAHRLAHTISFSPAIAALIQRALSESASAEPEKQPS